jgi:hypothetical protein
MARFNTAQQVVATFNGKGNDGVSESARNTYSGWFKCDCAITSRDICHTANTVLIRLNWDGCIAPLDVLKLMREWVDIWATTVVKAPDPYFSPNPWMPSRKIGNNYVFDKSAAIAFVEALVDVGIARQSTKADADDDAEWDVAA